MTRVLRTLTLAACLLTAMAGFAVPAVAADTAPPTVSITHPGDGGRAYGVTHVGAEATDDVGVRQLELWVDGTRKATDTAAPYDLAWDTAGLAAGSSHQLEVRASDAAGNVGTSSPVSVTIARRIALGAAVSSVGLFGDASYRSTVLNRFDSITAENEMKFDALEPQQGVFDFSTADRLLSFAQQNGKTLRGHVLVWGSALPGWLTSRSWTRDQLLAVLKNHIQTVVAHYKGQVKAWDVVNEAWNFDGTWRQNFWYQNLGPEYVEDAFRWAREADPGAQLFYNDYSAERLNPKSDAIYAMLSDFRARGVPIDGAGFQAHAWKDWLASANGLRANLSRFGALGLDVELTEMDVKTSELAGLTVDDKLRAEADIYRRYAAVCQELAACKRLTVWAVGDAASWLGPAEMPVLFDGGYTPKPAWTAVSDGLGLSGGPSTPPETRSSGGPGATTQSRDASFTFSSDDARADFQCRLNGAAFQPCASPVSYTGLADGPVTFEVRARNASANLDPTPSTWTWTVDTTAPDTSIASGPAASGAASDASFAFAATESGSTFECSLDGAQWGACTSPALYSGLGSGSHGFAVRATDAAGNADATPATWAWAVESPPPSPPPPAGGTTTADPGSTTPAGSPTTAEPAAAIADPAGPTAPDSALPVTGGAGAPTPLQLVLGSTRLTRVLSHGLVVRLTSPRSSTLRVTIVLAAAQAKRAGLPARRVTLMSARLLPAHGNVIVMRASALNRSLLRRLRGVKLQLAATDAASGQVLVSRSLTLR